MKPDELSFPSLAHALNYSDTSDLPSVQPADRAVSVFGVRRGKAALSMGARPTRQPLQPEAIGAVMEATKWLKPSISVSRIGDSASVQAAMRMNAEQASKMANNQHSVSPDIECARMAWLSGRCLARALHLPRDRAGLLAVLPDPVRYVPRTRSEERQARRRCLGTFTRHG
jgi:hypothetical protein